MMNIIEIFQRIPQASALIDIGHAHVNGLDIERFYILTETG